MLNILVGPGILEDGSKDKILTKLRNENILLKAVLKENVNKVLEYKKLLEEGLHLLNMFQDKVQNLNTDTDLWVDEVVRQYFVLGDLRKALEVVQQEITAYRACKIAKSNEEKI